MEWFPSIGAMAACLAILGSVVRDAGDGFTDDHMFVKPEPRQSAIDRIADVLGSKSTAQAIVDGQAGIDPGRLCRLNQPCSEPSL